jgi:hypothetical protein
MLKMTWYSVQQPSIPAGQHAADLKLTHILNTSYLNHAGAINSGLAASAAKFVNFNPPRYTWHNKGSLANTCPRIYHKSAVIGPITLQD